MYPKDNFKVWCNTAKEASAVLDFMDRTGIKWNSGDEITALEISDPNNRENRFVVPCGFEVGYYKSRTLTWNRQKSSFNGHNHTFEGHWVNEVFVDELMPRENPMPTRELMQIACEF